MVEQITFSVKFEDSSGSYNRDASDFFVNGTITNQFGESPSAQLTFENPIIRTDSGHDLTDNFTDETFYDADGTEQGGNPFHKNINDTVNVIVSGSKDGGTTWRKLFSGSVTNINKQYPPSGDFQASMQCVGAPDFTRGLVDYNQGMFYDCNIGRVFTGTDEPEAENGASWSGPWATDSGGNYPNGLLYDSGLSYSADSAESFSIITESEDFKGLRVIGHRRKIDGANLICNMVGGVWAVTGDDMDELLVKQDPNIGSDFTSAGYTISEKDFATNKSTFRDYSSHVKAVMVKGARNGDSFKGYYELGIGPKGGVKVVEDADADSDEYCYAKAKQLAYAGAIGNYGGQVTIAPQTTSFLGKKVSFPSTANYPGDYVELGNVVEETQIIGKTAGWQTRLKLDMKAPHLAKDVLKLKKDAEEKRREAMENTETGFYAFKQWSSGSWGSTSAGTNSGYYPGSTSIAIGIKTSSASDIADSANFVNIFPVSTLSNTISVADFTCGGLDDPIQGVVLFQGSSTDGPYINTTSDTLSRCAGTFSVSSFSTDLKKCVIDAHVEVDGTVFNQKNYIIQDLADTPAAEMEYWNPNELDNFVYMNDPETYVNGGFSTGWKSSVSFDDYNKTADFTVATHTMAQEGVCGTLISIPYQVADGAGYLEKLFGNAVVKMESATSNSAVLYAVRTTMKPTSEATALDVIASGSASADTWITLTGSLSIGTSFNGRRRYVSDDGYIRFLLASHPDHPFANEAEATVSIGYLNFGATSRKETNLLWELPFDGCPLNEWWSLPGVFHHLNGIYTNSDKADNFLTMDTVNAVQNGTLFTIKDEKIGQRVTMRVLPTRDDPNNTTIRLQTDELRERVVTSDRSPYAQAMFQENQYKKDKKYTYRTPYRLHRWIERRTGVRPAVVYLDVDVINGWSDYDNMVLNSGYYINRSTATASPDTLSFRYEKTDYQNISMPPYGMPYDVVYTHCGLSDGSGSIAITTSFSPELDPTDEAFRSSKNVKVAISEVE